MFIFMHHICQKAQTQRQLTQVEHCQARLQQHVFQVAQLSPLSRPLAVETAQDPSSNPTQTSDHYKYTTTRKQLCDVKYALHVLLRLGKNGGKWTDGRTPDCYIMLCIRSNQCIKFTLP